MQNFASPSQSDKRQPAFLLKKPHPDFIPAACHLNPTQIINSNGTIQQTIAIYGFNSSVDYSDTITQRDFIKNAIVSHLQHPDLAVWIHTVRSSRDLTPVVSYPSRIAAEINNAWNKKNYWHDKYVNDIYITIVHRGISNCKEWEQFTKNLQFKKLFTSYETKLKESSQELEQYAATLAEALLPLAPKALALHTNELGYCSDYSKFINRILHFSIQEEPLPIVDLAKYATDNFRIAFGNNALELSTESGKLFAAILTFKEYHGLPIKNLAKLLSLPEHFLFTEIITFDALTTDPHYEEQQALVVLSGDELLRSHLKRHPFAPTGNKLVANHQLSLMVVSPTLKDLNVFVSRCVEELSELGLLVVREDLAMEESYWAQLPANFQFIKRVSPVKAENIAGFANLHNYYIGKPYSKWGEFITLFRTLEGNPYRFNFHVEDNGNTLIIGPKGCGATVMHKFLLASATKFMPTIHAFQLTSPQALLTMALDGDICEFKKGSGNNSILHLMKSLTPDLLDSCWLIIAEIANHHYKLSLSNQDVNKLAKQLANSGNDNLTNEGMESPYNHVINSKLYQELQDLQFYYCPDKPFYSYLYQQLETISPEAAAALTHILLAYIITKHHGQKFIISIDCLDLLLHNPLFTYKLPFWLENTKDAGGIMIMGINDPRHLSSNDTNEAISNFATKILMAGAHTIPGLQNILQLEDKVWHQVAEMKLLNRHIAFIQDHITFAELNLTGLNLSLATLSEKEEDWQIAIKLMQDYGPDAIKWVPYFYQQIK